MKKLDVSLVINRVSDVKLPLKYSTQLEDVF